MYRKPHHKWDRRPAGVPDLTIVPGKTGALVFPCGTRRGGNPGTGLTNRNLDRRLQMANPKSTSALAPCSNVVLADAIGRAATAMMLSVGPSDAVEKIGAVLIAELARKGLVVLPVDQALARMRDR